MNFEIVFSVYSIFVSSKKNFHRKSCFINFSLVSINSLYFQDLSQSIFEPLKLQSTNDLLLFSLRSLCISTDHPLEFFRILFQIAPFLQHIKLIQTLNSSIKIENNQLYDCIHYVICQCQTNLKCLRNLHIQLRSASDQVKEIFFYIFK
jgi:hypothetical protein